MKLMKFLPLLVLGTVFTANVFAQEDEEIDEEAEGEVEVNEDGEADVDEPQLTPEQLAELEIQTKEAATGVRDPSNHAGRIVFRKKLLDQTPAVGAPLEIEYTLYNVGNTEVTDISVSDDSWSLDDFSDAKDVKFDVGSIAAGKSHSHKITLTPSKDGKLKLVSPKITYKNEKGEFSGEGATQGMVEVLSAQFHARNHASQWMNWLIFLVVAAPSTVFPYMAAENVLAKYSKVKQA